MFTKETAIERSRPKRKPIAKLNALWILGGVLSSVGMIVHSIALFDHFELTQDFSNFYQAAYLIGHGHLYPYDTLFPFNYPNYGFPFLQSHSEFFIWLLAPLVALFPNGLVLLVLQDLAIALTQILAALWIHKLFEGKHPIAEILTVGVFIFLNPWYYFSAFFDFHLEPFSMLFLLAVAYTYLNDRRKLSIVFILLVISTGDVPSTYLVGLGLGLFLLSMKKNRTALAISLVGALVATTESSLHFAEASSFFQRYGYLAGTHAPTTLVGLLVAVASGPGILFDTIRHHVPLTFPYLISGDALGILNPLGLLTALVILAAPVLVSSTAFLTNFASFQVVSMEPILTVAATMVILGSFNTTSRRKAGTLNTIFVLTLVGALITSFPNLFAAKNFNNTVSTSTASTLSHVLSQIPKGAEVISGNGTSGRFSGRRLTYSLITFQAASVPIWSHSTYIVVVANQGIADPSTTQANVIRSFLLSNKAQVRETLSKGVVQVYSLTSKTTGYNLQFPNNA